MRKSTFHKQYLLKGPVREVIGEIRVTMNSSSTNMTGTNAITHDDYTKTVWNHEIMATIDGQYWRNADLRTEEAVLETVAKWREELIAEMQRRSNTVPEK